MSRLHQTIARQFAEQRRHPYQARRRPFLELLEDRTLLSGSNPMAGDLDTSFGTGGLVTTDTGGATNLSVNGAALQPGANGPKILVVDSDFPPTSLTFVPALYRYNPDGQLDATFGQQGRVVLPIGTGGTIAFAEAVAVRPSDNSIFIVGYNEVSATSTNTQLAVAHLNADGTLDAGFGQNGVMHYDFGLNANVSGSELALQSDGKLVVGGDLYFLDTQRNVPYVARLNSDGSLDSTFANPGPGGQGLFLGQIPLLQSLTVDSQGRIVLAGESDPQGGTIDEFSVTVLRPDGTLDSSFNGTGQLQDNTFGPGSAARAVVTVPQSRAPDVILAAGDVQGYLQGLNFAAARYTGAGPVDSSFGHQGRTTFDFAGGDDQVKAATLDSSGDLLVAGNAVTDTSSEHRTSFALARLLPNGTLDTRFGPNGDGQVTTNFGGSTNPTSDEAAAVLVQPDGKIVLVGHSGTRIALARYLGAGQSNFTGNGVLRGTVFNDRNRDGVQDDPSEGPLAGWTVYLDLNHNGQFDSGVDRSTTTAADGTYEFDGLDAGTYTVVEVPPAGWLATPRFTPRAAPGLSGTSFFEGLTIADLTGTGPNDVAVAEYQQVAVFTPQPDGSYALSASFPTNGTLAGITAAPLDPDLTTSTLDLISVDYALNAIEVLPNNGDGTFQPLVSSHTGSGPLAVAIGPLNQGFRTNDLVVADSITDDVDFLFNLGGGRFGNGYTAHVPANPVAVALGDFDSDGALDVAVASQASNTVTIFLNNSPDGGFSGVGGFIPVAGEPRDLAVGDFNGDGHLDLAVLCVGDNAVRILLGDGHAHFTPGATYTVGNTPVSILAGDFNGDGITDLAVVNEHSNSVSVLLGFGDGTFVPLAPLAATNPTQVASGDLTGDGVADLAVINHSADNTMHYVTILARGGGLVQQVTVGNNATVTGIDFGNYYANVGDLLGTVFRDANGDGVQQGDEGGVANQPLFLDLNGNGTFDSGVDLQTRTDAQGHYFFGSVPPGDYTVVVERAQGYVATSTPVHIAARVTNTKDIGLAQGYGAIDGTVFNDQNHHGLPGRTVFLDLNGDGLRQANEPTAVTDGSGVYHFGNVLPGPYTVVEEQVPDWVATSPGDVAFSFTRPPLTASDQPAEVAGDLTTAGYPDIVVGGDVIPYLNNFMAPGTFPSPLGFALPGTFAPSLVLADFNGDGFLDLAAPNVQFDAPNANFVPTNEIALRLNDPTAPGVNFQSPGFIFAGTDAQALVAADFNRDGLIDLAVTVDGPHGSVALLLNDPTHPGTFLLPITLDAGLDSAQTPRSLTVADFNGDGLPDLAVGSGIDRAVTILLNDPNHPGQFLPAASFALPVAPEFGASVYMVGQTLLAADLNRDGRPDLVVASVVGTTPSTLVYGIAGVEVLLNDSNPGGPLSFRAPTLYATGNEFIPGFRDLRMTNYGLIQAVDLNRDGFLDLVVSTGVQGFDVLLNDPANPGAFGAPTFINTGTFVPSFVLADLNGDGALDMVLTGSSSPAQPMPSPTAPLLPPTLRDIFAVGIRTVKRTVTVGDTPVTGTDFGNHQLPDSNGDGIPDAVEALGPPDGAGGQQPNVATLPNRRDGNYVTFASSPGTRLTNVEAVPNPSITNVPSGGAFAIGFFNFTITGVTPGGSATVTLILHGEPALDPSHTSYLFFGHEQPNDMPHWFDFHFDATTGIGAEILPDRIVLHFKDGQRGDQDPTPGQIGDPGGVFVMGPATPVLPDPQTRYVTALYRDILGRDPDSAGLSYWLGLLGSGTPRAQVAQGIWESVEHRGQQVDGFYATYLHRTADPDGHAFWVQAFLGGASETDIAVGFLTSDEYRLAHPDTASFVNALYGDILGRVPDPVGLAVWPALAESPAGRSAVARGILTSVEDDLRLLDAYFRADLHRPADSSGQQDWLTQLQAGTLSPTGLAEGIPASDEFFSRAGDLIGPANR
jgi:uncharacterized delta-60 repeat protein